MASIDGRDSQPETDERCRQTEAERRSQGDGQRHDGIAVNVNADIDPGSARAKLPDTKQPAAPGGLAHATVSQQVQVEAEAENCRRPDIERCERQRDQAAGKDRQQARTQLAEPGHSLSLPVV